MCRLYIYKINFSNRLLLVVQAGSRYSAVGIATAYELDDRWIGDRVLTEAEISSSSRRRDQLWGPPSLLSNGYRDLVSRE
jgi:hypothetical protein